VYRILVGKPEGKRPLDRPGHRWDNNIKWMLTTFVREVVDWIELAQDMDRCIALVNTVMNIRVPQNAGNFLTG